MVVRLRSFSERKPRPRKRLCWGWSALHARQENKSQSRDASTSSLEETKRGRDRWSSFKLLAGHLLTCFRRSAHCLLVFLDSRNTSYLKNWWQKVCVVRKAGFTSELDMQASLTYWVFWFLSSETESNWASLRHLTVVSFVRWHSYSLLQDWVSADHRCIWFAPLIVQIALLHIIQTLRN